MVARRPRPASPHPMRTLSGCSREARPPACLLVAPPHVQQQLPLQAHAKEYAKRIESQACGHMIIVVAPGLGDVTADFIEGGNVTQTIVSSGLLGLDSEGASVA